VQHLRDLPPETARAARDDCDLSGQINVIDALHRAALPCSDACLDVAGEILLTRFQKRQYRKAIGFSIDDLRTQCNYKLRMRRNNACEPLSCHGGRLCGRERTEPRIALGSMWTG
jgi:hypothetical protein